MYDSGKYRFMEEERLTNVQLTPQEVKSYIELLQKVYDIYQTLMKLRDEVKQQSRKLGRKRIYLASYENTALWDILNKYEEDIEEI